MKKALRFIFSFFTGIAAYIFTYWISVSLIPAAIEMPIIQSGVAVLVGISAGYIVWTKTGKMSDNLSRYVFIGGILTGTVGFLAGFLGPMIFLPHATLGPLMGFVFGPLGFILGLVGGWLYWRVKVRKPPESPPVLPMDKQTL